MQLQINHLFILMILILSVNYFQKESDALSPIFPRQVIIDRSDDWASSNILSAPSSNFNSSQCKEDESFFSSVPDIEEINYLSDGKTLNATIWLSSSFKEPFEQYDFSPDKILLRHNASSNLNQVSLEIKDIGNKNHNEYTNERILLLRKLPSFESEGTSTTTISDNKATKISYTYNKAGETVQAFKIWTTANNKVYTITYLADRDRYSYYLPTVQNIIKYFDIYKINTSIHAQVIEGYEAYKNISLGMTLQYPSEWKLEERKTNGNLFLLYPPPKESLYKRGTTIVAAMDVNSGYDVRGEDYRVTLDWDPVIRNWTRLVQESRAYVGDDRTLDSGEYIVLEKQDNHGSFFNDEKNYVKLFMDLSTINFPDQYSLVFFVTEGYTNRNNTCNIDLFDMSDEVHVPPPEFLLNVSPSSVSLRPGEETNMELQIKNTNAKLNSHIEIKANSSQGINIEFTPSSTSVPPSGLSTSIIKIKAEEEANIHPYTFQITANITFPSRLTNYLTNERYNNTGGARISENADVTVTVIPRESLQEQLNNIIQNWFNPLTSTYTTIISIITGILGWRIWKRKKQREDNRKVEEDSH